MPPPAERVQTGTERQRDHQQETNAKHQAKGQQPGARESPQAEAATSPCRHPPDAIERVLQFREHGSRADHKENNTDNHRQDTPGWLPRAFQQALYSQSARRSEHALQLIKDLGTDSSFAEDKAGDGTDDK